MEEWFANFTDVDRPLVRNAKHGDGSVTWKQNFSAFWRIYKNDIAKRDMSWIRSIHPNSDTVETWMKRSNYDGGITGSMLKNAGAGGGWNLNLEIMATL